MFAKVLLLPLLVPAAAAFAPALSAFRVACRSPPAAGNDYVSALSAVAGDERNDGGDAPAFAPAALDRRAALVRAASLVGVAGSLVVPPSPASAEDGGGVGGGVRKVVVAGATGRTGRRILERLAASPGLSVVGAVRNVGKATKALGESSTDTSRVDLRRLDVVADSVDSIAETLSGADALVIAVGFAPSNPLKMNQAAHEVDNLGTIRLVDAAKKAGVRKVVMISSILTDGRAWGQAESPGFVVTNAFGKLLDEKLVAEKYLRASGLDYTIVRAGGLKAKPPTGALKISAENTLNSGEISRDLVADVSVAAISDPKASNAVLEIVEDEGVPPKVFNGLNM